MESSDRATWNRLQLGAGFVGLVALVLCAIGAALRREPFVQGYLVAYCFWLGIAVGSLPIIMVHHLTGGAWGMLIRRFAEAGARTLPLLALLLIPLMFVLGDLYPWARSESAPADPLLDFKHRYLEPQAFIIRAAVYFAIWIGLAYLLSGWSRRQDESPDPGRAQRMRTLSGPGLVLYGLAVTFAGIDWIMSLQPEWYSTMFGVIFGVAQVLSAMAFSIGTLVLLADAPPFSAIVAPKTLRDLGNLLLALVMFWTYVSFSQFLLIWSGNLPEEVVYYLPRLAGGWQWIAGALVLLMFAVPFLALLFRRVKQTTKVLGAVATLILVMNFFSLFWQIVPAFEPVGQPPDIRGHGLTFFAAVLAVVGLGGLWLAAFLWQLRQASLVPLGNAYSREVAAHG